MVSPLIGSLPHIFLAGCDEEADLLEEVILCGPNQLPNVMREVVKFRDHFDKLSAREWSMIEFLSKLGQEWSCYTLTLPS